MATFLKNRWKETWVSLIVSARGFCLQNRLFSFSFFFFVRLLMLSRLDSTVPAAPARGRGIHDLSARRPRSCRARTQVPGPGWTRPQWLFHRGPSWWLWTHHGPPSSSAQMAPPFNFNYGHVKALIDEGDGWWRWGGGWGGSLRWLRTIQGRRVLQSALITSF